MKYSIGILVPVFIAITNGIFAQQRSLVKKWETDSIFKVPESVLFDNKTNTLYVSNIDGKNPWAADGVGSIGKMSANGKNIMVDWVSGLQAPKGMGLYNNKLYVADLIQVVVIDVTKGVIEKNIKINGATGLNDITINNAGIIYVSDSKGKTVYQIKNNIPSVFIDSFSLTRPNGLLAYNNDLYVLDNGSLFKFDSKGNMSKVSGGMESTTDGVVMVNNKDCIVSIWDGIIYYIKADGTRQLLLDTKDKKINAADISFDTKNKILFVPTFWRNTVAAYELK
jgi:hypothetical protein